MPVTGTKDSFNARKTLEVDGTSYEYVSLAAAADNGLGDLSSLPYSLKVLLENMLRYEDGSSVTGDDIKAFADWLKKKSSTREIAYRPARVLMQDFTGVPAVVDLAAMRDAIANLGGDPEKINPLSPVDLVIDHSVMIDFFGTQDSFEKNVEMEFKRNGERYEFLRWGQEAFDNFRVVPPGTGICHQVNLEYLAQTVWSAKDDDGKLWAYPDTCVGTDSHTTMVNGLSVLGWGVGGIEAEAAMLGQPVTMVIPEVVGFKLDGKLAEGATATDLVLTVTQMLRERGVVGKFVEFYGDGLDTLSLADEATLGNMSPEFGSTCAIFPVDAETLKYLEFTGREESRVKLVEAYAKEQGMWREAGTPEPEFTDTLALNLGDVEPTLAGPKRPQDKVTLSTAANAFRSVLHGDMGSTKNSLSAKEMADEGQALEAVNAHVDGNRQAIGDTGHDLCHGDVVIAAITSCTNTSNPDVMVAAGLVARKARERGLSVKPWVKTSLAPGSQVVTDYLEKSGLQDDLDAMGYDLVGYGCTTCIGNSGPLPDDIAKAVEAGDLNVCSVLSGNRNFEGRISPHCKSNYLASPPLVVAYAIAGSMLVDLVNEPLGQDKDGKDVFLKDIWPTLTEIRDVVGEALTPEMFKSRYANVFEGPEQWRAIKVSGGKTYDWDSNSTYIQNPPFFEGMKAEPQDDDDIKGAKLLALLGDSVTTDHISPAGAIKKESPAGHYLMEHDVTPAEFNSYGARRGNHEVMMRGTFANIRIRNLMLDDVEGGFTQYNGEQMPIYDAAMKHIDDGTDLVVVAGKEYGTGSSRDWAAKGTRLLGVRAVIAESYERIHRSNLIGMGVLPLQFKDGDDRNSLGLKGGETFDISGIAGGLKPGQEVDCTITMEDGATKELKLLSRIDTGDEIAYFRNGGILHYVLRDLMDKAA